MICKSCGTEIADKALICYRCGTPTSSPARAVPPPARRSPARNLLAVVTLIVLVLAALFMGWAGQYQLPPVVSYTIAAAAALLLVWRLVGRRRVR